MFKENNFSERIGYRPNGFLGRYVARTNWSPGVSVFAGYAAAGDPQLAALGVEMVCGDLRDRQAAVDACRGADVVYHVGGIAGIGDRGARSTKPTCWAPDMLWKAA